MFHLENRYDPIDHYNYTHWPDSKYFRNYRFSPPISWYDNWSTRSRVWFPYYWSTSRLFNHYSTYRPSSRSLREQRKTIYLDYPRPIRAIDYLYYPYSYRTYRPLTLYYDYYWPLSSLNRYYWPHYPYYRYLYYKYTLPSDRYYHLKGKMLFLRDPISRITEYREYPTASYLRHKVYKPLSLYCDYYYPIRSLFWNSSYWPLYRSVGSFAEECPNGTGRRLQRIFDDETRLIRAQTASLLKRIHNPVPRVQRYSWPLAVTPKYYDDGLPARLSNDNYIHKLLITSSRNPRVEYTTYYTDPIRKYIGQSHLSCVSYAGERAYNRRPYIYLYEDPVRNDIQLLSYYINKFKQEKAIAGSPAPESTKVPLSPARPSRKFTAQNVEDNKAADEEMRKLREARAARLAFINEETKIERTSVDVDDAVKAKKKKDEERLAEEKALAEEQSRQEMLAKKEEAARRAELARQEDLAAQAAAERAAELERQAELAKQEELAKQAEIDLARKLEEERLLQEEERRREEEIKAEEDRKQLQRLEEIARQAEEEKEAELARQADELAELARQEAELAEQAQKEAELAELARQEEELADLARQEAELAELEKKEKELTELAEQAKEDAEAARKDAELADYAQQEAELAELERQQAELDALDEEAKALAADQPEPEAEIEELPLEEESAPAEESTAEEEQVVEEPAEEEDDEDAKRQREMDDLVRERFELAELERQQAELDALDAEAKALAGDDDNAAEDDDEEPAIAEDTPVQSDVEE